MQQAVLAWLVLLCVCVAAFTSLIVRRRVRRARRGAAAKARRSDSAQAEASMNFDRAEVRPFLERLVSRAPALKALDIETCVAQIATMGIDSELSWQFEATHYRRQIPVSLRAVAVDVDAIDLYFFTLPELASLIEREMRSWAW